MRVYEGKNQQGMPAVFVEGVTDFVPQHIFGCGQCFRWTVLPDGGYAGVAGGRYAVIRCKGTTLCIEGADLTAYEVFWKDYLDLQTDYAYIKAKLADGDSYLQTAVLFGNGIRLLRQEPFETLITFILSSNNNIPRIRGCVERIAQTYGSAMRICGSNGPQTVYAFPSPEQLAAADCGGLSACCRAGYRCAYIVKACAQYLSRPIAPEALRNLPLKEARTALMAYSGVGPKVADCILLFTGCRRDVFPVDVWVRRVMETLYFGRPAPLRDIEAFIRARFGNLAGYAQQYLFYYMRSVCTGKGTGGTDIPRTAAGT